MEDKRIINLILKNWNAKLEQATKLFDELSGWALEQEVVPGGNSVIYIIGHLLVVNDKLLEAMNLDKRQFPELDHLFFEAEKKGQSYPSYQQLRSDWDMTNAKLDKHFQQLTVAQWLGKHAYVNEEDFKNEPDRNVLNILISRMLHLAHHVGQLAIVKHYANSQT